jgi:hypothetical protein
VFLSRTEADFSWHPKYQKSKGFLSTLKSL